MCTVKLTRKLLYELSLLGSIVYFASCYSSPQNVILWHCIKSRALVNKLHRCLDSCLPWASFAPRVFQARAATANKDSLTALQCGNPKLHEVCRALRKASSVEKKLTLVKANHPIECDHLIISSSMQGMSAINFAKIHKLVFDTSCIQEMITHKQTYTDRRQTRLNT